MLVSGLQSPILNFDDDEDLQEVDAASYTAENPLTEQSLNNSLSTAVASSTDDDMAAWIAQVPDDASVQDEESSDDGDIVEEDSIVVQVQDLDGKVSELLASADTGTSTNFIFRSALNKLGAVEAIPFPRAKLKEYTDPLEENATQVPQFFVILPLYNSAVGLNEKVRLKVFEDSEDTNGHDIILGRSFIRKQGGYKFLQKLEEANLAEPGLVGMKEKPSGSLLASKRTKGTPYRILRQRTDLANIFGLE